jgi:hypothetical protein
MAVIPMRHLFVAVAFLLLIVLNLVQLALNVTLEKSTSELKSRENALDRKFRTFLIEEALAGRTVMEAGFSDVKSAADTFAISEILLKKPVSILFVFSSLDCSNCIHEEIKSLNALSSRKRKNSTQVLGLGIVESLDKTYLRVITGGIEPLFPVYRIEEPHFDSNHFHTPSIMIVDRVGRIVFSYVAVTGDETKRKRFQRVLELFLME